MLGLVVFIVVFVRTELAIALVLLSMLLSPEIAVGGAGGLAEKRQLVLRSEDLLLVLIGFSWLAKTAVNKELGLVLRTALNGPILAYAGITFFATLIGYVTGTVRTVTGFFYVLKYVEYFVVFFMVVNNLRDREQAWRLVAVAFATAMVVSLIGVAQIPGGQRVSAPFEGESGEPNTFGGYLLLMMALAGGIALETPHLPIRIVCGGLVALMSAPFVFTLSRSSYLGLVPMVGVLAILSNRRKVLIPLLLIVLAASPLLVATAPTAVQKRVLETFRPQVDQPRVQVGQIGFDPSTSERLLGYKGAVENWLTRPILGRGVTGGFFIDAQYPRTLMETGVLGIAALFWLIRALLKSGLGAFRGLANPQDRGLALGFVAGTVALLAHAVGSNTFIIIRIMEPFWFFAGVVLTLQRLQPGGAHAADAAPAVRKPLGVVRPRIAPAGRLSPR